MILNPSAQGLFFAILSPFTNSVATIFKSEATKLLTPLLVASIGSLAGSALLFLIIFITREKINLTLIKLHSSELIKNIVLRAVLAEIFIVYGLSLTTGVKAIFFTKVEPYFVLFWHWLIKKEKVNPRHIPLLFIHLIGAFILSTGGELIFKGSQLGDLLIIAAMAFFSLSYLPGSGLAKSVGARLTNAITLGVGGLILLPFALFLKPVNITINLNKGWLYLAVFVVLFNVISLTLWYASLKSVKGWMVSALRSIGPLAGIPVAWFLFGQRLTLVQGIGGVVVLVTSALIAREHLKGEKM